MLALFQKNNNVSVFLYQLVWLFDLNLQQLIEMSHFETLVNFFIILTNKLNQLCIDLISYLS